ncbi:hypothetical protein EV361DRAFT_182772 [Lentinula raphanica]|nr:hypothetical protein EV361DRAFT_182772 [Lentinula raphanica]
MPLPVASCISSYTLLKLGFCFWQLAPSQTVMFLYSKYCGRPFSINRMPTKIHAQQKRVTGDPSSESSLYILPLCLYDHPFSLTSVRLFLQAHWQKTV